MVISAAAPASGARRTSARGGDWFYFAMAVLMAAIIVYGFSQTIGDGLLHPKIAPPPLLYLHAALMGAWIALFVGQAGLVRLRSVRLHRQLGLAWLCVGAAIPIVGVATAIVMRRFDILHLHDSLPFMAVPLGDMLLFPPFFVLAALWRHRPEHHRRLMFLATCVLLGAGLGRFPVPDAWFMAGWFYGAIDVLVLIAIGRDLIVLRRVHPVFALGLPLMMAVQLGTWLLWRHPPGPWLALLRGVVGAG